MAFKQYALTLTGVAQRLSTVLGDTQVGGPQDQACRQILFSADPANTAVVYIGDVNVAAAAHAFSLDPTQATAQISISVGPFIDGPVKLSDFYALGTNAERLMIGIVPY